MVPINSYRKITSHVYTDVGSCYLNFHRQRRERKHDTKVGLAQRREDKEAFAIVPVPAEEEIWTLPNDAKAIQKICREEG